jgi:hypothetical protein
MNFPRGALSSKVAHRTFGLFVACALLPVSGLAALASGR